MSKRRSSMAPTAEPSEITADHTTDDSSSLPEVPKKNVKYIWTRAGIHAAPEEEMGDEESASAPTL